MIDVQKMSFADLKAAADFTSQRNNWHRQDVFSDAKKRGASDEELTELIKKSNPWGDVYFTLIDEMTKRCDLNTPPRP